MVVKTEIGLLQYTQAIRVPCLLKKFSLSENLVVSNLQQKEEAKSGTAGQDFFV